MLNEKILEEILNDTEKIMSSYACKNASAIREFNSIYDNDLIRTQYAIDIDKILHSVLYNRGNDKTQVFSFYRNDDITRRSTHVQLVSRIGRVIGRALRLNLDLIEAIAVGHDIGHTPFGHKGEAFLNKLYHTNTGRYFNHNVHSVRVLQKISKCNLTLQTLDGILCHCGEKAFEKYEPASVSSFKQFNEMIEKCYTTEGYIKTLHPSTLEGCVVRISDIIAYIGKDRQDALKAKLGVWLNAKPLGDTNAEIITTLIKDVIFNSYNRPYLSLSPNIYKGLREILDENNSLIYQRKDVISPYYEIIEPMMELMYNHFLNDLKKEDQNSLIYRHYVNGKITENYCRELIKRHGKTNIQGLNDIVSDFIASMTDDYFIDAFSYLYREHELTKKINYIEYFDERFMK